MQPHAEQVVEQHIARLVVRRRRALHPLFEDGFAGQAHEGRRRRRLAHMIGLHRTTSQQRVGSLVHGFADQELELARLASAGGQAGAVVTLDEQALRVQAARQALHGLQRRRPVAEPYTRKFLKVHDHEP
jgi:hypothetical protein